MTSAYLLIIFFGYIGIASGMVGVFCTSLLFGGPFRDDGYINFVSDGFAKYSVVSTVLYGGITSHFILAFRIVGIIRYIRDDLKQAVYIWAALISTLLFLVAIRYDKLRDISHIIVSILSAFLSLSIFASTMVFNQDFHSENPELGKGSKYAWWFCIVLSIAMVVIYPLYTSTMSVLTIVAIFEFILIEILLTLDLILLISVEDTLSNMCELAMKNRSAENKSLFTIDGI